MYAVDLLKVSKSGFTVYIKDIHMHMYVHVCIFSFTLHDLEDPGRYRYM